MKTIEARNVLLAAGWRHKKDSGGDTISFFDLDDRVVAVVFRILPLANHQRIDANLSVSTDAFMEACRKIQHDRSLSAPLSVNRTGMQVTTASIQVADVVEFSERAIAWARSENLDLALKLKAELATSSPGALPIWHLAALALTNSHEKLRHYLNCFVAGDRLGFVPYITQHHIERALEICEPTAKTVA